jgi:hypothetical protein
MEFFRKARVGTHWRVDFVNPDNATERYLVGGRLFGEESAADNFAAMLNRIAPARIPTESIQISELHSIRDVRLVD